MFNIFDEDNSSNLESTTPLVTTTTTNVYSSQKKGFVISVGGSVFIGEKPLVNKIIDFCNVINELNNEFNFVLVIGGGKTARVYRDAAKELGANNFELDSIGIKATRFNAMLFLNKINNISKKIVRNYSEIDEILQNGKIPILGGMSEGQTSDAVASLVAEKLNFEFINLSNVDGIYDTDPNTCQDATLFEELSFKDMNYLLEDTLLTPGQHTFVDKQAANILSRSKIKSYFLNGNHLQNFKNCLQGNDFKGTIVCDIEDVIDKKEVSADQKFNRYENEKLDNELEENFVENNFVDEEQEEIDPRNIDFGR